MALLMRSRLASNSAMIAAVSTIPPFVLLFFDSCKIVHDPLLVLPISFPVPIDATLGQPGSTARACLRQGCAFYRRATLFFANDAPVRDSYPKQNAIQTQPLLVSRRRNNCGGSLEKRPIN
jgi:hypothetical protein